MDKLPANIVAEKLIIGIMLLDNDSIPSVFEEIKIDDICDEKHKKIFEVIYDLWIQNKGVDIISVSEKLENEFNDILQYLSDAINEVPTKGNLKYYLNVVFEKSLTKKLLNLSENTRNMVIKNKQELKTIINYVENNITKIGITQTSKTEDIIQITDNTIKEIKERIDNKDKPYGIQTGFHFLDKKLIGIKKSDLVILAARPSMGKSSLAVQIADNIAFHEQLPVMVFSIEMNKEKIIERILSSRCMIENEKFKTGNITEEEFKRIELVSDMIKKSKMIIDDTPGITFNDMFSKAKKQKMKYGELSLIVIDHLTEMYISGKNARIEISENARNIRNMGKILECPVLLLVQVNRSLEGRKEKRPQLSDLRETGVIEEVADIVMFIYRDSYYTRDEDSKDAEIIIAKNRDGETGTVELNFLKDYTKFEDKISSEINNKKQPELKPESEPETEPEQKGFDIYDKYDNLKDDIDLPF